MAMQSNRIRTSGKFLTEGPSKSIPKGVSYGTFAPDARGEHFPPLSQVAADFAAMRDIADDVGATTPKQPRPTCCLRNCACLRCGSKPPASPSTRHYPRDKPPSCCGSGFMSNAFTFDG